MGLLPLRGPPKPQPYENTKRFVRRCRSLFSSVLLSGAQGGSLSASHTNHPFCAARCLPGRRRSGRANDFSFFAFFDRLKNHFFSTATQISQV